MTEVLAGCPSNGWLIDIALPVALALLAGLALGWALVKVGFHA